MNTSIEVEGLRIYAFHGVAPQENIVGNWFEVNLSITYPFEQAMDSDDLNDTASYATLCDIITQEMSVPSKLLEHVAGRIIKSISQSFPKTKGGTIKISKLKPPIEAQLKATSITVNW